MANSIIDPKDPDYCERCGGECVAPEHRKRLTITWSEKTIYEATIEVPDDYPERPADLDGFMPNCDGEDDWWQRVEAQIPDWPNSHCIEVKSRAVLAVKKLDPDEPEYHE